MDKAYADTVRLLLTVAPDVFAGSVFAMKGGTAINLFVRDMPRLSVDIDVAYTPWEVPREQALEEIASELSAIGKRLVRTAGLNVRTIASRGLGDSKLVIDNGEVQVKVEVNVVFRGTVLPVERRALAPKTATMFSAELELPVLAVDELYGSKLVAAMDRQHPRDLFDVWRLHEDGSGLSDAAVECFVVYLAGHNRPTHEVLFAKPKDIGAEYHGTFVGMTSEPVSLETLLATRERLFRDLPTRLNDRQRHFLISLTRADPDWTLLQCPHAADLPALRWKLTNLQTFKRSRPGDFERQLRELETRLG
jgi:predicted nucleotidyltransferase component of viral defense system